MKIISVTQKSSGIIKIYDIIYETKLGKEKTWSLASRNNIDKVKERLLCVDKIGDAVAICAIHESENKVVMIKEQRPSVGGTLYSFPAGLIDLGETSYESATRELKEETGLDLYDVDTIKSTPPLYSSAGICDELVSIVYGKCRGNTTDLLNSDSEEIETILMDKLSVIKLLISAENNEIKMSFRTYIVLKSLIKNWHLKEKI